MVVPKNKRRFYATRVPSYEAAVVLRRRMHRASPACTFKITKTRGAKNGVTFTHKVTAYCPKSWRVAGRRRRSR